MFQVRFFLMVSAGRLQWCTENLLNDQTLRNELAQTARVMFPEKAECGVAFWPIHAKKQSDEQIACAFLLNRPDPIQPARQALHQYVLIISAQDYRANQLNPFALLRTVLTPEVLEGTFPENGAFEPAWQAYENNNRVTVIDNRYGKCEISASDSKSQEEILKSLNSNLEEVETYLAACMAHPEKMPALCFSVKAPSYTPEGFLKHAVVEELEHLYLSLPAQLWTTCRFCWAVCQEGPDLKTALKSDKFLLPKTSLPSLIQESEKVSPVLGTTIIYGEESTEIEKKSKSPFFSSHRKRFSFFSIFPTLLILMIVLLAFYAGTFFGDEQEVLSEVKTGFLSIFRPEDLSEIDNEKVPEILGKKLGEVAKSEADKGQLYLSMTQKSEKDQLDVFKAMFFEAYQTEKYDYTKALNATKLEELAQNLANLFHEKDSERSQLKRKIEAKNIELSRLETDLGEQTAKIGILHEQKREHWAKVAQLETALEDKLGEIEQLNKKIEDKQETIVQLEKRLLEDNQESENSLNQYEKGYSEGQKNCYVYQERKWSLGCGHYIQGCKKVCK
jgi:predicted  nucleic acid-binding Zn-ribbon protein